MPERKGESFSPSDWRAINVRTSSSSLPPSPEIAKRIIEAASKSGEVKIVQLAYETSELDHLADFYGRYAEDLKHWSSWAISEPELDGLRDFIRALPHSGDRDRLLGELATDANGHVLAELLIQAFRLTGAAILEAQESNNDARQRLRIQMAYIDELVEARQDLQRPMRSLGIRLSAAEKTVAVLRKAHERDESLPLRTGGVALAAGVSGTAAETAAEVVGEEIAKEILMTAIATGLTGGVLILIELGVRMLRRLHDSLISVRARHTPPVVYKKSATQFRLK